jgi:hypothetical protein
MEYRSATKTATELRAMIADMDKDKNRKLSFIEFACAYFQMPFDELNNFVDEDARRAALAEAKAAADRVAAVEAEHRAAAAETERLAKERADQIEAESKLVIDLSVSGSAAQVAIWFCRLAWRA